MEKKRKLQIYLVIPRVVYVEKVSSMSLELILLWKDIYHMRIEAVSEGPFHLFQVKNCSKILRHLAAKYDNAIIATQKRHKNKSFSRNILVADPICRIVKLPGVRK
jgi:hypothetical protein